MPQDESSAAPDLDEADGGEVVAVDLRVAQQSAEDAVGSQICDNVERLLKARPEFGPPPERGFSQDTRRVLLSAWRLAGLLGHRYVLVEHVMAMLLASSTGTVRVASDREADLAHLTGALVRAVNFDGGRFTRGSLTPKGQPSLPDRAQRPLLEWIGAAAQLANSRESALEVVDLIAVYMRTDAGAGSHFHLVDRFHQARQIGLVQTHVELARQRINTTYGAVMDHRNQATTAHADTTRTLAVIAADLGSLAGRVADQSDALKSELGSGATRIDGLTTASQQAQSEIAEIGRRALSIERQIGEIAVISKSVAQPRAPDGGPIAPPDQIAAKLTALERRLTPPGLVPLSLAVAGVIVLGIACGLALRLASAPNALQMLAEWTAVLHLRETLLGAAGG